MDLNSTDFTRMKFQRRSGGRAGCGCCGFYLMGLLLLPVLAIAGLLVVI